MSDLKRAQLLEDFIKAGVSESVRGTPLENALLEMCYPEPAIVADASLGDSARAMQIKSELQEALDHVTFDCPMHESAMRVIDYFTQTMPLMDVLAHLLKTEMIVPEKKASFQKFVEQVGAPETAVKAIATAIQKFDWVLIRYGRCDARLFYVNPSFQRNAKRHAEIRFTLKAEAPRERQCIVNGNSRPVFQCGQPFGLDGIEWVSWNASRLGIKAAIAELPVYVQRHALDGLYDRLGMFRDNDGGDFRWYLHDFLWQCLREPEIVCDGCRPEHVLVKYRLNQHCLGYLPAVVVDGQYVVVRTFLFLTMDGTPESRLLRSKLSIVDKYERERVSLDRLSTFLLTDVHEDKALRKALTECGCGHLFEMAERVPIAEAGRGQARAIREYLRAYKGIHLDDQ
jgi:hypothetical protein